MWCPGLPISFACQHNWLEEKECWGETTMQQRWTVRVPPPVGLLESGRRGREALLAGQLRGFHPGLRAQLPQSSRAAAVNLTFSPVSRLPLYFLSEFPGMKQVPRNSVRLSAACPRPAMPTL